MIKLSPTLSRYIANHYIRNMLLLMLGLLLIIYLFDTVELIRRASKRDDIPFTLVLQMGLLKLPEVSQVLFPFAILFSAMFTFWQLTRRYELIIMRSSGFSVWQFLTPILGTAFLIGVLQITLMNPIGALLISKFEQLENTHLKRNSNQIAIFSEGLWLRQNTDDKDGYIILHADKIDQKNWELNKVMALSFDKDNNFIKRIDTNKARLSPNGWILDNAIIHKTGHEQEKLKTFRLPTTLTAQDIEDSFASPESMSFWRLPSHIKTLEKTGFDATRLKVHYQNLLSQPLMFIAMVLLAASVSIRPPRMRGTMILITAGIFIAFTVFFLSSFLQALGVSHQIPVFLAAWSPAIISALMGITMMLNLEDG